jgi:hypothetical protein
MQASGATRFVAFGVNSGGVFAPPPPRPAPPLRIEFIGDSQLSGTGTRLNVDEGGGATVTSCDEPFLTFSNYLTWG